ncbi:hypothetical protein BH11MYX4_BH11MYX4_02280 [soil metagenome]
MTRARSTRGDGLLGLFFHTHSKTGAIELQGHVVGVLATDRYLIAIFDWFDGREVMRRICPLERMGGFTFYTTAEDLRLAYEAKERQRQARELQDRQNPTTTAEPDDQRKQASRAAKAEAEVIRILTRHPNLDSKNAIVKKAIGQRSTLFAAIDTLVAIKRIERIGKQFRLMPESPNGERPS